MNIFYKMKSSMRTGGSLLALLIFFAESPKAQTQKMKSPLQLADQYFAAGEYYTAANLYGQYLKPSKEQQNLISDFPLNLKNRRSLMAASHDNSRAEILFKQAESYRLANYWEEAADAYKECLSYDAAKYVDAMYWYAVCERSLGQYANARQSLQEYFDLGGQYKEAAHKEGQTLEFIQQQLARPDSILFNVYKLDAINSSQQGVFAPVQVSGNKFLVSSTETDPIQTNGVNPHHSRLFYATLKDGSLEEMIPVSLSTDDPLTNQGAATISADGNYLYFSQWKKENGNTVSAIYFSVRQDNGWSIPALLSSVNLNGYNSKQPFCSADGKYFYFSSDRPGGSGGFDIWYASLNSDGTTGQPVNAGTLINTKGDEQTPFYHNTSVTLVFSSNGHKGMGGFDLFAAKGNITSWVNVENLGHPVNSSRDDVYFFAPENSALLANAIFSSDRGEGCCLETYAVLKTPKNKMLSGLVYDCNNNTLLPDATVIIKDESGKQWETKTDGNGKYAIDLGNDTYSHLNVTLYKEFYFDRISSAIIDNTDETDWLTDKLFNRDLCLDKVPEEKTEEPEPLVIKAEDVVTVFFDFDRSLLKAEAVGKLDSIYNVLVENPGATIQISGYTDGLGSDKYNAKLSDRRARACASYLIKKGIKKERVSFASFGKCCPVEMEIINGRDNPDGRSKNRRALINIKKD